MSEMTGELSTCEESELINAARENDLEAFSELVRRHQGSIRACLVVRMRQTHEAEDLAQEAFLTAYRKMNEFEANRPFGPWVRGIALNLLKNHWRKHKPMTMGGAKELEILIDEQIEADDLFSESAVPFDSILALKSCMKKLPDALQRLMTLHYQDGVSVQDLTKLEGVKHSTMTMRLHRTRQKLRDCIDKALTPELTACDRLK